MTVSDNQSTTTSSDRFSRLREVLSGSPKTRSRQRLQRQMQANRPRNAMLAILLHACARLERGEPLSDVETKMLDSVREYNSDEDLKEFGRIYQELTPEKREALFPGRLATRSVSQSYSQTEFKEDLDTVISELMSQPNVRTINVDELPPDAPHDPDDEAFREAIGHYGHGIVMYTSSPEKNQLVSTETKSYAIRMTRFYCTDNSDEWTSDELYFSVGGASDLGNKSTYTSGEIGDVDPDETHRFPSGKYAFKGKYQTHISIDVEIWEKDQGSSWGAVANAVNQVADYCLEVSRGLAENNQNKKAAGIAALVAIVGYILGGIFGMMEDDFMCQRTLTFDAGALQNFAGKEDWWWYHNPNDSGAADLKLYLQFTSIPIGTPPVAGQTYKIVSQSSGKVLHVQVHDGDGTNVGQIGEAGYKDTKWRLQSVKDGYYSIINLETNKALCVPGHTTANGANIKVVGWNPNYDDQLWRLEEIGDGYYCLVNKYTGKVADVDGSSMNDYANVLQWAKSGSSNQLWRFEPA